jgi:polyisoprenoid-binding protein YceI
MPSRVRLCTFALLPLLSTALQAQETEWRIDSNHSNAYFSIRHLMISTVRGQFTGVNGTVHYDPKHPAESSVQATISCDTVTTGVPKRDQQLKGPDFFEVAKYPQMKFVSRRVEVVSPGKLKIAGDLTINATTRAVALDVDGPSAVVRDAQGREKMGLSVSAKINRKDFGIVWNEVLESGGFALADEVAITLDIELLRALPGGRSH